MRNEAAGLGISIFNHFDDKRDTECRGRINLRLNSKLELKKPWTLEESVGKLLFSLTSRTPELSPLQARLSFPGHFTYLLLLNTSCPNVVSWKTETHVIMFHGLVGLGFGYDLAGWLFFLLHVVSVEITCWYSMGGWPGLGGPRELHSHVWHLVQVVGRLSSAGTGHQKTYLWPLEPGGLRIVNFFLCNSSRSKSDWSGKQEI